MPRRRRKSIVQRLPHSPNRLEWRERWVRLLGKKPDSRVARQLKIHATTVREERVRRGIAPFRLRSADVAWTPEMISLLGEATDKEVAAELGLGVTSVSRKRGLLGIAPYGRSTRGRFASDAFWTKRRLAQLGTMPDLQLARRWQIGVVRIAYRRGIEGIAPFRPRPRRKPWSAEESGRLGQEADEVLARRFGRTEKGVREERIRRRIAPFRKVGGKVLSSRELERLLELSNREVMSRTGISLGTVSRLRRAMGVEHPPRASAWTRAALSALGRVSDEQLAKRLGLGAATVQKKRQEAGIRKREVRRWTPREDALVRSLPVREAARRCRRSPKAVRNRRAILGITREELRWTPDVLALLGKVSDGEIARRIGVTRPAVRQQRLRRGVAAPPNPKPPWTAREDELLRRHDASTVSALTGRTLRAVQYRRRITGLGR